MSSSEFDKREITRLRKLAEEDGAKAHRNGAIEHIRRAAQTTIGRAAMAGGVILVAGATIALPRIGGHGSAYDATHRTSAAAAESLSTQTAISAAIEPTMTALARAALKVHKAHPGSVFIKKPDGKGGGSMEIEEWASNGSGAITSIDVVMGLTGNKPDTEHVLFAAIEAPADDQAAADAGYSDVVWFTEAGGKKYAEQTAEETTADAQNMRWTAPAAYSHNYIGPGHGVVTDTTSQAGLAPGDSGETLSAADTAAQIANTDASLLLDKIDATLG